MSWYVIHSKPQKEELLYEQLCIRKMNAYYPSIKIRPVNPRARKRKPYFPGYLFVNTDLNAIGASTLKWMPGAIGLVGFGDEPASVPDEFLQKIQHNVNQINALENKQSLKFKHGDQVTIQSGPFVSYRAIFDSYLSGRERVRVLLQMLQDRQVGINLSGDQIEL